MYSLIRHNNRFPTTCATAALRPLEGYRPCKFAKTKRRKRAAMGAEGREAHEDANYR